MLKKFVLAAFLILIAVPAYAIGNVKVGDTLPSFQLEDYQGKKHSFDDLVGKNGMVLVFFRSAQWCPYCKAQLIDLKKNKDKFEKEGYSIVGISYDTLNALMQFEQEQNPGYVLLSDPASKTIREFGLFNNNYAKGTLAYGVPHPAIYVVGKDKKVQAVLSEEGYKERPEVKDILAAIESAKPKPAAAAMGEEFPADPSENPNEMEVMEEVPAVVESEPDASPTDETVTEPVPMTEEEPVTETLSEPAPAPAETGEDMPAGTPAKQADPQVVPEQVMPAETLPVPDMPEEVPPAPAPAAEMPEMEKTE